MDRYVEYVPLDGIQLAVRNPKAHDTGGIDRSITHHGFADLPLLDERTNRLVAGHGRIETLRSRYSAGTEAPDGVHIDDNGRWLVPVIRGWASRSDADAEAYATAANRLTELGGWDDRQLAEILRDLADNDLLSLTGYTPDDLDALIRSTDVLGDQATAFLGPVIDAGHTNDEPDDDEPATPGSNNTTESAADYTTISWLVTVDDRTVIRTALAAVQRRYNLDTTGAALVTLARNYLDDDATVTA